MMKVQSWEDFFKDEWFANTTPRQFKVLVKLCIFAAMNVGYRGTLMNLAKETRLNVGKGNLSTFILELQELANRGDILFEKIEDDIYIISLKEE